MKENEILQGDSLEVLKTLEVGSVQTCITSPPYFGLRDYGVAGQIGLEETPEEYVAKLVALFSEVKRVLKKDGTLWLNLGDSYAGNTSRASNGGRAGFGTPREGVFTKGGGLEGKQLMGIPWRVAFALQADGWYLRQDIIWHKPNPMPESVTDRCTKAHEYVFLLSKSPKYYFDNEAVAEVAVTNEGRPAGVVRDRTLGYDSKQKVIQKMFKEPATTPINDARNLRTKLNGEDAVATKTRGSNTQCGTPEPGYRNRRSVWTVTTKPYKGAHFATFPEALIEPCVLAGAPKGGVVLDPFMGAGTTAVVAKKLGRNYLGIELNPEYIKLAENRIKGTSFPLF